MARDDMLTSGSKLRAGGIFEHFPVYRENIERDLRPREIRHHDDIVDRTAKLLIAHGGEILLGTNAAPFRILKVCHRGDIHQAPKAERSEEHTSEIQSLMRISYAVFCLKQKKKRHHNTEHN